MLVCASTWKGWGAMVTNWKAEKPRSKRMGEGGFGAVYRGMQPDGTEIAVKAPLELGRGSTFAVFVQTCPSCHHLRLKSHVQRPANLVYTEPCLPISKILGFPKDFHWTWWQTRANMDNFASLIDMSGVAECSRVRFRRWGIAFLGFCPKSEREDSTFFLEKIKVEIWYEPKYREDLIAKVFSFFCEESFSI